MTTRYCSALLLICVFFSSAQTIRINEVVSSNSVYLDEDGDTPDWFELHNYGTQNVSLENWNITDDSNVLDKWSFPSIILQPNEYLLVWASGKDRSINTFSRTLINQGDVFKYNIPNNEPDTNWKNLNFDSSLWSNGSSGFGYGDGDDNTSIPNGTLSVYLRKTFIINDLENLISLILDIDYDDAFVAYINGIEICRANINGVPPPFDSNDINTDHEAQMYSGGLPDRFNLTDFSSYLIEGENVLAIQAHNISSGSSDFTIIPFLSTIYSSPNSSGIDPPEILNLSDDNNPYHTNFKIASSSETLTLSNDSGTIVDELLVEGLPSNTSVGVSTSSGNVVTYIDTTPGYENSDEEFLGSIQQEVVFSENGGFKDDEIVLTLSGNINSQIIRFTDDGTVPTSDSQSYTDPFQVSENSSIRARIFQENYLPSSVFTESYVFGVNHDIDAIMLTVDPDDFFDDEDGIYVFGPEGTYDEGQPHFGANFWEDWERPVHLSFHETNSDLVSSFNGGVKIFGGWSRGQNGQRSLSFFARGQYGDSKFEHPYFDNLDYNEFQALVLRSSGQDWLRSNIKDITLTSLMRGSGLDFQEHNPVATYINGEYWGMYNMREKVNEHMLASKHNLDADRITLLFGNAEIIEGDNDEYNELIDYIQNTDLTDELNFDYVRQRVDLKQYALYQATNIFVNNTDWPGNNIKFWKHPDTKWRWIMYDTDFGFGPWWNWGNFSENTLNFALNPNGPGWPNPPWSTLLFRKLITNLSFRNQFINRYADELNTRFLSDNVSQHINQIFQSVQPEIVDHVNRWKDDPSVWYEISDISGHIGFYIWAMTNFANQRPSIAKEHIKEEFNLPNFHPLTITNQDIAAGFVEVNENLNIQEFSWTGDYFETVPVKLTATAEIGYEFSHWSGDLFSTNSTIEVLLEGALEVIPNFTSLPTSIVINEINYRSSDSFNVDDWVELYNPKATSIDLSNWKIKDNDDSHVYIFPEGTQINGNGFLVIVKDQSDFINFFPEIPFIGDLDFGFGSSDAVRLYNADNTLIDEVYYESEEPWPICADETGNTIELIDPDLDNTVPENWDCINQNGSPNAVNSSELSAVEIDNEKTINIYPNPVFDILHISGTESSYDVEIYSILGHKVIEKSNTNAIDLGLLNQGIYLVKITNEKYVITERIIKN